MLMMQNPMGSKEPERLELHCPDCAGIVGLPRRGYGHSIPGHPLQAFPAGAVHPAVLMLRGTKVFRQRPIAEQPRKRFMFDIEKMDMSRAQSAYQGSAGLRWQKCLPHPPCMRNKLNSKMEFPQILDLEVILSKHSTLMFGILGSSWIFLDLGSCYIMLVF